MNTKQTVTLLCSLMAVFQAFSQEQFNTADTKEYGLSISNDGTTAVFFAEKGKTKRVMFAQRPNLQSNWATAQGINILNEKIENGHQINHLSLSGDGSILYFSGILPDTRGGEDIYYTQRKGADWSDPTNIGDPINTALYDGQPSLLADGTKLAFVRENFNAIDKIVCYAIWVSDGVRNTNWGTPQKLPEPINLDCEQNPFLMNDGNSIVFSSIREGSLGGFDLYQSELQGDKKWSLPQSLPFLNGVQDDKRIALFGKNEVAYGDNSKDLSKATVPLPFRGSSFVRFNGNITNQQNGGIAAANITATNVDNPTDVKQTTTKQNGAFWLRLKKGNEYLVRIEANDYQPQEQHVGINDKDAPPSDFVLVPIAKPTPVVQTPQVPKETQNPPKVAVQTFKKEVFVLKSDPTVVYKKDTTYTLNDVYFDKNSATIRFDSYTETTRLYELLRENPQIRVQLSGYSNSYGDPRYNQQLSERRAKSVKDYLISIGVDEKRLAIYGFGESELVFDNRGKEDTSKSRRVRFIIY